VVLSITVEERSKVFGAFAVKKAADRRIARRLYIAELPFI